MDSKKLEDLLGVPMEQLENETNEVITTNRNALRIALMEVVTGTMEISHKHFKNVAEGGEGYFKEGEIAEHTIKIVKDCLQKFPTLREQLKNL